MRIRYTLTGAMPILFHADDVEAADDLKLWRDEPDNAGVSVAGDDRSPPWTWQTYLYTDGAHLTIPSDNLMVCLRKAGAAVVIPGGRHGKTFKEATQSCLMPVSEHLEFFAGKKQIPEGAVRKLKGLTFKEQAEQIKAMGPMRIFVKRAKVGQSKHVRCRLRVEEWAARGEMLADTDSAPELTPDVLRKIFGIAGAKVGICDWRPSSPKSPGPYGVFQAKLEFSEE